MIVNYGDFYFDKDDGHMALGYAPDPDGKDIEHIMYVEPGDSLADLVGKVWAHQGATPDVVDTVKTGVGRAVEKS